MTSQFTNDELFDLTCIANQLTLMGVLVGTSTMFDYPEAQNGLRAFLDKQASTIKEMVERLQDRLDIARNAHPMCWADWLHALRIAAGDGEHSPLGAKRSISEKLKAAAQLEPEMAAVLREWLKVADLVDEQPQHGAGAPQGE